jgi:WD40 repeat protein
LVGRPAVDPYILQCLYILSTQDLGALTWQQRGSLLATGGKDGRVALWPSPRRRGEPLTPVGTDDGAPISEIAWVPDGSRLAIGRGDGTVELQATTSRS